MGRSAVAMAPEGGSAKNGGSLLPLLFALGGGGQLRDGGRRTEGGEAAGSLRTLERGKNSWFERKGTLSLSK